MTDTKNTHTASDWRINIARKIAPIYAAIPAVRAVVLIGGVARGRGDRYSDIDLAAFWDRTPTEAERRAAVAQFEAALGSPIVIGEFTTRTIFDPSDDGLLWEESAFMGGDAATGLKIDVNHRTTGAMERIFDDVLLHHDTHGHKLEVMYSIRRVLVLHGANLIAEWQARAGKYPNSLAHKLVDFHLSQLKADFATHVYRGDWLLYQQAVSAAVYHLMGTLLAINHIYRPELKRMRDLCDEMNLKPKNMFDRVSLILRGEPEQAARELDALAEAVFSLVSAQYPHVDVAGARRNFFLRRPAHDEPPVQWQFLTIDRNRFTLS